MHTLYEQSLNTELILEAYLTLYPQYIPDSSLGLDDGTTWRGESRKCNIKVINFMRLIDKLFTRGDCICLYYAWLLTVELNQLFKILD